MSIPEGTLVHNIELRPGDGGKLGEQWGVDYHRLEFFDGIGPFFYI